MLVMENFLSDFSAWLTVYLPPNTLLDIAGWIGTTLCVTAYLFVSLGKLKAESFLYGCTNAFGGLLLILYTLSYHTFASVAINVFWLGISLVLITRLYLKKRSL